MKEFIEINTDNMQKPDDTGSLMDVRRQLAEGFAKCQSTAEVTICVVALNRLRKTKNFIDSVIKYTKDIDYELLVIDNGSADETPEYLKTLEFEKLRVVRLTKTVSLTAALYFLDLKTIARYFVFAANDMVVSENWLSNMLSAAKSDPKIGMIATMSTNVSNLQDPGIAFTGLDDFQRKAAEFNKPNPAKWHERLRLITTVTLWTKECLTAIGWPVFDIGYAHDFADDDIPFRIRRMGYKSILAGDVLVCHDHDRRSNQDRNWEETQKTIEFGKRTFREKYLGVDAWDDVNNFAFPYIGESVSAPPAKELPAILGIDVRAGTPILDIKNIIRKFGIFDAETNAFSQDGKYYTDLMTFCSGKVICDRIDFFANYFESESMDFIIIGKDINEYAEPMYVTKSAFRLLKPGGQMFLTLKNVYNAAALLSMLGHRPPEGGGERAIMLESFMNRLSEAGINKIKMLTAEGVNVDADTRDFLSLLVDSARSQNVPTATLLNRLGVDRYWMKIVK